MFNGWTIAQKASFLLAQCKVGAALNVTDSLTVYITLLYILTASPFLPLFFQSHPSKSLTSIASFPSPQKRRSLLGITAFWDIKSQVVYGHLFSLWFNQAVFLKFQTHSCFSPWQAPYFSYPVLPYCCRAVNSNPTIAWMMFYLEMSLFTFLLTFWSYMLLPEWLIKLWLLCSKAFSRLQF